MQAFGFKRNTQTIEADSIELLDVPIPTPSSHDLLVKISAVAVNPVDTKIRKGFPLPAEGYKTLGYDAVGVVTEKGDNADGFNIGDRVYYSGDVTRHGCHAEYQVVDHRLVATAPESLTDEQAAALPLTSVTAWELLFERLAITPEKSTHGTLLVVGGAGGVGSILIQLAKQLTSLTVIATASRPETKAWCQQMGADIVVDHSQPLDQVLAEQGITQVDYVASLTHTHIHFAACTAVLKPFGKLALIDDPGPLDIGLMKRKSQSLHWEYMPTKIMFNGDVASHGHILRQLCELADNGQIKSTLGKNLGNINQVNLLEAHRLLEQGKVIGKLVLSGFDK